MCSDASRALRVAFAGKLVEEVSFDAAFLESIVQGLRKKNALKKEVCMQWTTRCYALVGAAPRSNAPQCAFCRTAPHVAV